MVDRKGFFEKDWDNLQSKKNKLSVKLRKIVLLTDWETHCFKIKPISTLGSTKYQINIASNATLLLLD